VIALLLAPLATFAGVDKPWKDDNDGGSGELPGASLFFGVLGAAYLVHACWQEPEFSLLRLYSAAVLGFSVGFILGLPVACMLA
jgi:hypothetical protein